MESIRFVDSLTTNAKQNPFAIAIVSEKTVIDYKTLDALVWQYAGIITEALHSEGFTPGSGSCIAIKIPNPIRHFVVCLAVLRMGSAQISISEESTLDIIDNTLTVTKANLLVCDKKLSQFSTPQLELPSQISTKYKRQSFTRDPDSTALITLGSGTRPSAHEAVQIGQIFSQCLF